MFPYLTDLLYKGYTERLLGINLCSIALTIILQYEFIKYSILPFSSTAPTSLTKKLFFVK